MMTTSSDKTIRALAKELLDRRISRRGFVRALAGSGVAVSSARALAASLEAQAVPRAGEIIEAAGGEVMARALEAAGVEYVFGIPGTDEVGFIDALVDHPDLRYVLGLHEGPIAAMADGYAKVSGRPAFVNVHTIAGAANALGQLVNSSLDGTPVVFTAGNQDSRLRGRGSFLESPHLETLPQSYARWTWDVLRADMIPDALRRAFKIATTPPGGPVFLTFSKNLWQDRHVRAELLPQERFTIGARIAAEATLVERAARLLLEAERPLLLAGDEVSRYGGRAALVELAELLALPVVGELVTGHGRINFPTRHPQYLGSFPGQRDSVLPFDLFFDAGGRMFSEFAYEADPIVSRGTTAVHLSVDAAGIGRAYPVDLPIVADVGTALAAIVARVRALLTPARRGQNPDRLREIAAARAGLVNRRRQALEREWRGTPISPARLAADLNDAVDANAIVLTETITSDAFVVDYIDFNNGAPGRTHLVSHGGNLGWGIGAACGAKLAAPDRQVVLLSGDGSFQFGIQGLWTAARYDIPVLFVVFNNGNYQSNRVGLIEYGGRSVATGRFIGTFLGDPDIDHVGIARGYGLDGERVTDPEALGVALGRGLQRVRDGRPYVLDVVIRRRFQGAEVSWYEKFSVAKMARKTPA